MRKLVYIIILMVSQMTFSQVYELGLSYNIGKITGEQNGIFPIHYDATNFGGFIKKNMNSRISYRLAANHITSDENSLTEISAGIDFNFTKFDLTRIHKHTKGTPYVIFELAALQYKSETKTGETIALPIGLGYKKVLFNKFIGSIEAKGRIALTDELDGIKTNKSTLDAYYYIGASISYTFGWPKGSKNQTRF